MRRIAVANYRYANALSTSNAGSATLTRRVYESLREEIVMGQFAPGDRLVRRALGKRLGVSPMPVTEALYMLELDGLVESRALFGCRVRPLTLEDVRNDEVLREALECQAARLCAEHATDAELKKLATRAKRLDRMMRAGDSNSTIGMQLHLEFHVELACSCGFVRLADELRRVWSRLLMRLNWIKATRYKRVPRDWHQQLVDLLQSRNLESAEAGMRAHVRFGSEDDSAALQEYLRTTRVAEAADQGKNHG